MHGLLLCTFPCFSRSRQKPKIEVLLIKSNKFDEMIASEQAAAKEDAVDAVAPAAAAEAAAGKES